MSSTKSKKCLVVFVLLLCFFASCVSADFLNVDAYGLYYDTYNSSSVVSLGNKLSSGDYSARWSLSGLSTDYTYDCWIQVTLSDDYNGTLFRISSSDYSYYSTLGYIGYPMSSSSWSKLSSSSGFISKVSDNSYEIHMYYNSSSGYYSATLTLAQEVTCSGSGSLTFISQGVGVYYDPGGSDYAEILTLINNNVEGLPEEIASVLEKHDQDVKQEASTQGNDNISQATSSLSNALPIASISDALAPLITACGYNGITSVWTFPAMKIPAISGLFAEIQLNDAQSFDLCAYAEQYIPEELLVLIRSITAVLLIVWAIKEIMSILTTLLGGKKNV